MQEKMESIISLAGNEAGAGRVAAPVPALERASEALRESEERFRRTFELAGSGIAHVDLDGHFLRVNHSLCAMLGYSEDELVGRTVKELSHPEDRDKTDAQRARVRAGELASTRIQKRYLHKNGATVWVNVSVALMRDSRDNPLYEIAVFDDITEHKASDAKILQLTQLYAALSRCGEAIVRCTTEDGLFAQICRDAVEFGGMKSVRVALVEPDTRTVRIAASFSAEAQDLETLQVSSDANSPFGRGPTGTAIRENRAIWCQDFLNDPTTAPWHERGARLGWGSVAALPLHRNRSVIGVLCVFYGNAGAFEEPIRELLIEMASNISYALDNLAREAARIRAEQELRAAEEQFRGLVEQSIAGIFIIQDGNFSYVNPRLAEICGYDSSAALIGSDPLARVIEQDRARVAENRQLLLEGGARSRSYNFTAVRKDGSTFEAGAHAARATHKGRPAIIGLVQDISEKTRAEEQALRYLSQLETAFMSTVEVATALSEMRDPYTAGHERQVGRIAAAIGAELGLDTRRQEGLRVAGFLHDIGKITIPAEILSKPGKLTAIEYELIKGHPQSSYDVLKDVEFPWPVAQVALQHHERLDGSGYPRGLKGDAILLEARIMAVADVIEAMSSHRPYRPGLGMDAALAEIMRGRGSAYDPAVADACIKLFSEKGGTLLA